MCPIALANLGKLIVTTHHSNVVVSQTHMFLFLFKFKTKWLAMAGIIAVQEKYSLSQNHVFCNLGGSHFINETVQMIANFSRDPTCKCRLSGPSRFSAIMD